VTPK